MTTDELLSLIEQDAASHRLHECHRDHPGRAPVVTLGTLADRAGVSRRAIEEAVQASRLDEYADFAIDTRHGITVLRDTVAIAELADWLDARLVTQRRTVNTLRAVADRIAARMPAAAAVDAQQATLGLVAA